MLKLENRTKDSPMAVIVIVIVIMIVIVVVVMVAIGIGELTSSVQIGIVKCRYNRSNCSGSDRWELSRAIWLSNLVYIYSIRCLF